MRVASCVQGSSAFAICANSFFAPERRSQTARELREESDGCTSRRRSVTDAGAACRSHRLTSEPNGDSRGSSLNVKRSSSRPYPKRQVISSGLTTSITITRLPVRRSTTISPRCGMDNSIGSLSRGCETGRPGRPPLLGSFERLSCSRVRFEQLAPYVEERPTDEHGSPEQDESGNDGHRDGYAGKPRDEAHALPPHLIDGHGGLLKTTA